MRCRQESRRRQSLTAPRPGRMQVGAVDEFGGWSEELEVCANKLEGAWEREKAQRAPRRYSDDGQREKVRRAPKRYSDDGHCKSNGLRLLLLAAVTTAAEVPPTNENGQTSNDKEVRQGAKVVAALQRVNPDGYGASWCF